MSLECWLRAGAAPCHVDDIGFFQFYEAGSEQAVDAYNRNSSAAKWWFAGFIASVFAMYASWKHVKPDGWLANMMGVNGKPNLWTRS